MPDEENPESPPTEDGSEASEGGQRRGGAKLAGGVLALVATGGALAFLAIPKKAAAPRMEGPFITTLTEEPIPVSTIDSDNRRYVKFAVDAEFKAYEESYVRGRWRDPFFAPTLRSRIELAASDKTIKEITEGLNREAFAEEMREELEGVVFPLHIGKTTHPLDKDDVTGLRPGVSHDEATFRGYLWDHALRVDGTLKTLRIDDGPVFPFTGVEEDLRIETDQGETVFVDVTHFVAGFVGEVPLGTHGRLRRLILHQTIAQ